MKKKFATAILTLVIAAASAQDAMTPKGLLDMKAPLMPVEKKSAMDSFAYMKGNFLNAPSSDDKVELKNGLPGFGVGYRMAFGANVLDVSMSGSYRTVEKALPTTTDTSAAAATATDTSKPKTVEVGTFGYELPRVTYLRHLNPTGETSVYLGAGAALSKTSDIDGQKFIGIVPNVTLGCELFRTSTLRSFVEVSVQKGLFNFAQVDGKDSTFLPKAAAALTVGVGF